MTIDLARGFVAFARELEDHPARRNPIAWAVYTELVFRARYSSSAAAAAQVPRRHEYVQLEVGQAVCGLDELGDKLNCSTRKIRTALDQLTTWALIHRKTTSRGTIVTLDGYSEFWATEAGERQAGDTHETRSPARRRQAGDTHETPNGYRETSIPGNGETGTQPRPESATAPSELFPPGPSKPKLPKTRRKLHSETEATAAKVIAHLNARRGTRYSATSVETLRNVSAALNRGETLAQIIRAIDYKIAAWSDDPKMREYLGPSTLLRPTKLPSYIEAAENEPLPTRGNQGGMPALRDLDPFGRRGAARPASAAEHLAERERERAGRDA